MKNHNSLVHDRQASRLTSFLASAALGLLLAATNAQADMLVWNAGNTTNGPVIVPADGTWDTTAANLVWYKGSVSSNVTWTQTSTTANTNGAIFGGADGTYAVLLDAGQIALTNLTFTNSGYTISGSSGLSLPGNSSVNLSTGVTATINCPLPGSNAGIFWNAASNSAVVVNGNMTGSQQPRWLGPGSYYFGGVNSLSVPYILGPVFQTNGSFTTSASFFIAYNQTVNGVSYNTGTFTIDGPTTTFTHTSGDSLIARGGGTGKFVIRNGATANIGQSGTTVRNLRIGYDNNANNHATLDVQNGTLNVGSGSLACQIIFGGNGSPAGLTADMTQEGGTVNCWGGLMFGGTAGGTGGTASFTMSGGALYLGAGGIGQGTIHPSATITLSGGIVGAFANWSTALPITLGTANGDVTFLCADPFGSTHNVFLSGALTGTGGLVVSGGGMLNLSGANNYSGTTVVSNGTLVIDAGALPVGGPVTLNAATGSSTLSVSNAALGHWSIGNLAYSAGSPTADFAFGVLPPSATLAPLQVAGNVAFTVTPNVTVEGSALSPGIYPLITYTGTPSGTPPTTVTLPGYAAGYITNLAAAKTIALVITTGVNPALSWRVGNGVWDTTTANWAQFGASAKYTDGDSVVFDDSAQGSSPITVTLSTSVAPSSVTANNSNISFTIAGTGSIGGSQTTVTLLGKGTLTLSGANTYGGGTVLSAGQLNINNGGNASASAIGTGPLTINVGAAIDNTSGTDVTLNTANPQTWSGSFTYLGSSNSLNTGAGAVALANSLTITVPTNTLTVGGSINDNGASLKLTKSGNGVLTLPVANYFGSGTGGGFTLSAGLLNVGDAGALGSGTLEIDGGSIDNISGQDLVLNPSAIYFGPGFTFIGTTNLDLGPGTINNAQLAGSPVVVNVMSNTLTFEGLLTLGNSYLQKTGNGTLTIAGTGNNSGTPLFVTGGQVNLGQSGGHAIGGATSSHVGLTVTTNALAVITSPSQQIISGSTLAPVTLIGGTFDLNGYNQTVDSVTMTNGATLQDSDTNGLTATLTLTAANVLTLANANEYFNVNAGASILRIPNAIVGPGSLVKLGAGELILATNNSYSGSTVIAAGTLALTEPGSISNSVLINVASGATVDASGRTDQTLTLSTGQTLAGIGIINGNVVSLPGATLAPGAPLGTLLVTNNIALGGNLLLSLDRTGTPNSSRLLSALGNIAYGGTLSVTNTGPALHVGDSFQLFPSAITAFSAVNLSTTDASGSVYTWANNVAVDGSIKVLTVQTVNRTPIDITFALTGAGKTLNISWPPDHLGWTLATNAVGLTATNAWFPYPGSTALTNVSVPLDPSAMNVFFRLFIP